jgi:hypothetical protein
LKERTITLKLGSEQLDIAKIWTKPAKISSQGKLITFKNPKRTDFIFKVKKRDKVSNIIPGF